MALLQIDGLNVSYGEVPALRDVSLAVEDSDFVVLLGANGAGKTTLLRTISGLLRPTSGRLAFDGRSLDRASVHEIAHRGLLHVPEGRGILAELTVEENLRLGMYMHGVRRAGADLDRVTALFPILRDRAQQLAGMLSGGEQQMLAIARSLLGRPRLLMIDELSLGLAPKVTTQLLTVLSEIRRQGVTVIVVEQNAEQALRHANRVLIMANGSTVFTGAPGELVSHAEILDAYLGRETNLDDDQGPPGSLAHDP